jgi:acyl carrier protein
VITTAIEKLVLDAMQITNQAREADQQLQVHPQAVIFGPGSPLDSLGLVALLLDIEETLRDMGHEVTLGDERAMSMTRSPFRSVPALVQYIENLIAGS